MTINLKIKNLLIEVFQDQYFQLDVKNVANINNKYIYKQ